MRLVTVSASYGSGGSIISPMLAERLGVPFLDRPVAAKTTTAIDTAAHDEAARPDEDVSQSIWSRILEALAAVPDEYGTHLNVPPGGSGSELRQEAERRLSTFAAANQGGVVLGYAGALVLDGAYRVRLDGPADRRLAGGMKVERLDEATARARLEKTDRVRAGYWKRLYQRDIRDPAAYDLMIDSTLMAPEAVVEVIATAFNGFLAARG
ncbi:MAG: cytidylate kinase-like family protein [Acidimicrobiales bacterium]